MDDLSTILHEAKYKEAMLDLKRRPIRRIPELPRTLSSRKLTGMADVDLHTLITEPIGVWFLRKFADLDYKLAHAAEEQRGAPLSRATDSAGLIDDILDDTTSVSSFSDDSSIHGLPDQHEGTFLKFVNAFYARKRADPSNSVSRSIVVLLIRHYDLDILEPVLRGLSAHGFDPAVQKTLASALDEAMAHDSPDAAATASASDEDKDSESGPDRATKDDEDELIDANDENASRSDFPVPELLKKASTIVDHPDDEFHPLLRVRRLPGSVGSIDLPASREEAFGGLPDHLDPLEQDENDHGNQDDQELDGEVEHEIDDDDDVDDDDAYSISNFPDGHEADEGAEATRALKNGAADDDDADSNGRRTSRVGETDRRRFSSTFSDLPLTSAVTKLRRANSINHLRAQERRRQIVSLRKLHSERTIGLNEAIEVLIRTVCEPMFLRFSGHKASMRNYCRIKSFAMRPVQDAHFTKLRVLGRGATGRVYACMHMHTGRPMAMKVMPKKLVKFRRTFSQVKSERRVLEALASKPSPYCMRLLYAYQTKESFHFVLPLAIAGDLRFHLSKGPLPHKRALVYAAEIAYGLGHIHSLGYVMRDLKPRNILLDAQGRCRISDFGLAVNVGNGKLIRGRAGTVGYWSPQVLSGERYGQDADWWSYGVCVYELFAGFNPFSRRFTGYSSRNEATLHAPVRYPQGFPKRVALFVSQLLERDIQERLGCLGGGANEVLDPEHGIWKPLDLDAIRTATHEPVWTPDSGVVYAESESEIAANEERKLPDVHKVKVLPSDMPEFDDFVAIFDHMTDISRVLSFHVDEKALQADILNKYRRGKLPLDASDAELMRSNSKCLLM